jgi:glyoxalase family protein
MPHVHGSHHVTLSVGGAQEDVDFHTRTLGMRFIKRTVLFDGTTPVYHLYYANADGDPGSVVTTFPFGQAGVRGRRGTNQAREVLLAAPAGSLDYWSQRLVERGVAVTDAEVFGRRRLLFRHPCGIEYALVPADNDPRRGFPGDGVPPEHALHGLHGVGIHVTHPENMVEFVGDHIMKTDLSEERDRVALHAGDPGRGDANELVVDRAEDPGTWVYGEGTIHHFAWNAETLQNQDELKIEMESAGYTDISELKDRKYFKSVYVRTPSGALFELAVTHVEGGWTCDESPKELGSRFQLPSRFEARRIEFLQQLEPIEI